MSDPVFGKNWKINTQKSTVTTSSPVTDETRRYEEFAPGYRLTVSGSRDGQPYEWGYTVGEDGIRCPVHGRSDVDTIEKHRINDFITVGSFTKNGRVVASYRREVEPDGTALTVVASGRSDNGAPYFDVLRYEP
jgi:hypothetical protein